MIVKNSENGTPKVCVIMPVYNGEGTLKYALASLLGQSYQNWECVIVNDGSTDKTRDILNSLNDTRFKIYHLDKNRGRGYARDVALSHAEGKYLSYIDADDMLHSDKILKQVEYLEEHEDVLLVSCGCIRIKENMSACGSSNCKTVNISPYRYGNPMPLILPASKVRLDRAKNYKYDSFLDVGEDLDYFSRYSDGSTIASLPYPYYFYMTGNVTTKKLFYYQWNSMRRGITLIRNKRYYAGIKHIARKLVIIFAYSVMVPLVGTDRIVNKMRYKNDNNMNWKQDYDRELKLISQRALELMGVICLIIKYLRSCFFSNFQAPIHKPNLEGSVHCVCINLAA